MLENKSLTPYAVAMEVEISDLTELYEKLGIPPLGVTYIESVRRGDPARRVKRGRANVCLRIPFQKIGTTIQAESVGVEFPFVLNALYSDNLLELYCQPEKIKVSYIGLNGKKIAHFITVDYLAIYRNCIALVECKTETDLEKLSKAQPNRFRRGRDGQWISPPGIEAARHYGCEFKVFSSKDVNPFLHRNLIFLADYLNAFSCEPSEESVKQLGKIFSNKSYCLLSELLEDIGDADEVYLLIVNQYCFLNLEQELLAYPDTATVYREKTTAKARQTLITTGDISNSHLRTTYIDLKPGAELYWDSQQWQVVNVGSQELFLKNDQANYVTIESDVFYQLLKEGKIVGITSTNAVRQAVEEKFLGATESDLSEALYKYEKIRHKVEGVQS